MRIGRNIAVVVIHIILYNNAMWSAWPNRNIYIIYIYNIIIMHYNNNMVLLIHNDNLFYNNHALTPFCGK